MDIRDKAQEWLAAHGTLGHNYPQYDGPSAIIKGLRDEYDRLTEERERLAGQKERLGLALNKWRARAVYNRAQLTTSREEGYRQAAELCGWAAQRLRSVLRGIPVRDMDELLASLDKAANLPALPRTYEQGAKDTECCKSCKRIEHFKARTLSAVIDTWSWSEALDAIRALPTTPKEDKA